MFIDFFSPPEEFVFNLGISLSVSKLVRKQTCVAIVCLNTRVLFFTSLVWTL